MASCCAMVFTFLLELLIYLTVFFLFVSVSTRFIVFARRASPLVVPISLVVLHFARRLATVPYRLTLAAISASAFMPPLPRACSVWPLTSRRPPSAAVSLSAYRRYARPHSRASISPAPRAHTVLPKLPPARPYPGDAGFVPSGIALRHSVARCLAPSLCCLRTSTAILLFCGCARWRLLVSSGGDPT